VPFPSGRSVDSTGKVKAGVARQQQCGTAVDNSTERIETERESNKTSGAGSCLT